MSLASRIIMLAGTLSFCVQAQAHTLGLYVTGAEGLSPDSSQMMRVELQRLLTPAGIEVIWKDHSARKRGEDFNFVAVGSFQGSCSATEPMAKGPSAGLMSLGDTSVSGTEVLPFFQINCPQLVRMLTNEDSQALMGRALARVIAHELYHIIGRTPVHRNSGIAKAAFSVSDLLNPEVEFDIASIVQMKRVRSIPQSEAS
jgi:hypothetical protein